MRSVAGTLLVLTFVLAGCSLAGDITPPPALATAQAAETLPPETIAPTDSPDVTAGAATPGAISTLPSVPARGRDRPGPRPVHLAGEVRPVSRCHGSVRWSHDR